MEIKEIEQEEDSQETEEAGESEESEDQEESEGFGELEQESEFEQDFVPEGSIIESRAPVLESAALDGPSEAPLEEQIQNAPLISSTESEEVAYVQNAPQYEGTDYAKASYQQHMKEEGVKTDVDREMDITKHMTMHRQPEIEEQRSIGLRDWQQGHVSMGGQQRGNEPRRSYQVAGAKQSTEESRRGLGRKRAF